MRKQSPDRLSGVLTEPFRDGSRIDLRLVVVFLAINGLVLINALNHDPRIGFDSRGHFDYVRTLSTSRLVTADDSIEFFSPPLPYALPAFLMGQWDVDIDLAMKAGQLLNVLLSVGLTWYLLRIGALLDDRTPLRLGTLIFLGVLPVYYKSFVFVRGEPWVAFFTVVILYYAHRMFVNRDFSRRSALMLGGGMGLSILARQWGVLLLPAVYLLIMYSWIHIRSMRRAIFQVLVVSTVLAAALSGWFYLHLRAREGSFIAFNRIPESRFSFANQPMDFYLGITPRMLFRHPFRPNFANQLIPILYSEVWGDYWGYFSVASMNTKTGVSYNGRSLALILETGNRPDWFKTNYDAMVPYLGNVNLVSLPPSLLAVVSLGWVVLEVAKSLWEGRRLEDSIVIRAFWLVALASIMAGYLWFLIRYPSLGKGDTIKATYILQVFPIVSLMVGNTLERIRSNSELAFQLILAGLVLVAVHNLPAMVSHY